jgi:glycosyl-4,4'-diaponeurosporenoate acyltransferase
MTAFVWCANFLGWPIIHLVVARILLHVPTSHFQHDSWVTQEYAWEGNGSLYRKVFAVQRWKSKLPDGAPWLGGMSKRHLVGRNRAQLTSYLTETRRAEIAHWGMLLFTPVFFLWNPPWACTVMAAYGLIANVPCILAQRANRIQLARILRSDRA